MDGPIYECHLCGPRSKMPSVAWQTSHVLSEVDTYHTHTDLVEATKFVCCIVCFQGHQWGQPTSNSSPEENPQSDNPTSNIRKPVAACSQAHLQTMLWKAADHQGPPNESADITHFGWEIRDDIPIPQFLSLLRVTLHHQS